MRRRALLAGLTAPFAVTNARAEEAEVTIPFGASSFPAFRAGAPQRRVALVAGDGPASAEPVRAFCRRLAGAGFMVIAPADGPDGDDGALGRLEAASAWAAAQGSGPGALVMTGFGHGGRLAWLFAAQSRTLRAAVAWGSTAGAGQRTGVPDIAEALRAPVLGLYGADDPANPRSALLELERKGRASGHPVEIVAYTGAAAAFALPGQPGYDEAAALDGWQRMLAWFRRFA